MFLQMVVSHFFLWLSNSPLHIFIQLPVEGHFIYFPILANVNDAAMNVELHISLPINVFRFFG